MDNQYTKWLFWLFYRLCNYSSGWSWWRCPGYCDNHSHSGLHCSLMQAQEEKSKQEVRWHGIILLIISTPILEVRRSWKKIEVVSMMMMHLVKSRKRKDLPQMLQITILYRQQIQQFDMLKHQTPIWNTWNCPSRGRRRLLLQTGTPTQTKLLETPKLLLFPRQRETERREAGRRSPCCHPRSLPHSHPRSLPHNHPRWLSPHSHPRWPSSHSHPSQNRSPHYPESKSPREGSTCNSAPAASRLQRRAQASTQHSAMPHVTSLWAAVGGGRLREVPATTGWWRLWLRLSKPKSCLAFFGYMKTIPGRHTKSLFTWPQFQTA